MCFKLLQALKMLLRSPDSGKAAHLVNKSSCRISKVLSYSSLKTIIEAKHFLSRWRNLNVWDVPTDSRGLGSTYCGVGTWKEHPETKQTENWTTNHPEDFQSHLKPEQNIPHLELNVDYNSVERQVSSPVKLNPPWGEWGTPWPGRAARRTELTMKTQSQKSEPVAPYRNTEFKSSPKALDTRVARSSDMERKCGLMRSSIVTVAKELKAEEMVLDGKGQNRAHNVVLFNLIFILNKGSAHLQQQQCWKDTDPATTSDF